MTKARISALATVGRDRAAGRLRERRLGAQRAGGGDADRGERSGDDADAGARSTTSCSPTRTTWATSSTG